MPKTSATVAVKNLKKKYVAFLGHDDLGQLQKFVKDELNDELKMAATNVQAQYASDKRTDIIFRVDHAVEVANAKDKIKQILT